MSATTRDAAPGTTPVDPTQVDPAQIDTAGTDAPAAPQGLTLLGGAGVVCEGDVCEVPGAGIL